MKLKGRFREDSLEPFSNVLKGLNGFAKFAKENEFVCFRFSEKYLYISGNEEKNIEIMVTIKMNDLFYEDYILKSSTNNEIIFLVYVYQLYDIFKNIAKNTQVVVELIEKNGFCLLSFEQYCNLTEAFKKFECGIEIVNPNIHGFPKKQKITKNSVSVTCKLKKCCKILKAYTKIYTKKVILDVVGNEETCDISFITECSISKHTTILKGNRVLRKREKKTHYPTQTEHSGKHLKITQNENEQIVKTEENQHDLENEEEQQPNRDRLLSNFKQIKRQREQMKLEEGCTAHDKSGNNEEEINLTRILYKKSLLTALNILNDCRNNKESGIFKLIIPYTKCWMVLNLSKFESSGTWEIDIIVTDVYI